VVTTLLRICLRTIAVPDMSSPLLLYIVYMRHSPSGLLRSFRVEFCGLTQSQLGAVLNHSWQTISAWENGHDEVPRTLLILIAVCRQAGLKPQNVLREAP
jgi:DNA-binding XRE family transcriptional regulator